ncbi:Sucrose-phosphate synthase [Thalictrum thalictroides]|uniref:Sucrose-phosphate synthase n=1 Tax=Thalictrum thalictroides TaxID=46969 RepID=A0A7J6X689_THATH|nr:Sucrose-phosphate synthase [Thalictrum thalictroides]
MEIRSFKFATIVVLAFMLCLQSVCGIRFVIDREECFSHSVQYEGDTVHVSFVVIKADAPWHYGEEGVDLVVKGPSGDQIHDFRDKTSEKFEFVVHTKGLHQFCFTNKSPYHETIDFDVHVGHFTYFDQHAKDEHFNPLLEQIGKLEEALYNIQFEQHWLEAQTDRQSMVNEGMSKRAMHKAMFESAALIGVSVLQVYLLRRLFERKLGTSRLEWEDSQRLATRRYERELGRKDATEDMSEDLSESERPDSIMGETIQTETPRKRFQRNFSNLDNKGKKLYIILIRYKIVVLQLLISALSAVLIQIKYVVELARALAMMPGVYRVDLFTRQISSPEVDWSYGEPTEMLTSGSESNDGNDVGESSGAYIVRIPFGPRDKYLHKGFDVKLEKVLRARARRGVNCHGRYMPRMAVIPPGMDFSNVVQEKVPDTNGELLALIGGEGSSPRAVPPIWSELMRFFTNPHKPIIMALRRPDPKKNLTTLLKAFGECRPLRELANLTLVMGNRDDIDEMSSGNASVLTTVLKLIDKYDLYGHVAYPKTSQAV